MPDQARNPQPRSRPAVAVVSPADPGATAAREVLRVHLHTLTQEEAAARGGDVEGVHRLRVGTRRLRAALRVFGALLPPDEVTRAESGLQWMGREIGAVRDLDVLKIALSKQSRRLDPELQRALRPVHRHIVERRRVALAAMIEALDSPRYRELLTLLQGLVQRRARLQSGSPIGEIAPDIVRPAWRALVRAHRRLESNASAEHYHRLRVRAKRLRYTLESLQTLGGKRVRRTIERLVGLQDLLGAQQDAVTQCAWLRGYASATDSSPVPPVTLLAIGAVIQTLARRERRCRARVPAQWKQLAARGLQRKVHAELHYPGQRPRPVRLLRTGS